jgi:hypothetical protein
MSSELEGLLLLIPNPRDRARALELVRELEVAARPVRRAVRHPKFSGARAYPGLSGDR